jgi:hypothetical protein
MKLNIHQDVLGLKSGSTDVEVDGTQAEWLVREGYASVADTESDFAQADKHLITSADAENDPTLAVNREAPDEYDAAGLESDADNGDAQKLAEATNAAPVRTTGATEKRDAVTADESTGTAGDKAVYEGDETPTAGPLAVPVNGDSPVTAVADVRVESGDAEDDTEADKA